MLEHYRAKYSGLVGVILGSVCLVGLPVSMAEEQAQTAETAADRYRQQRLAAIDADRRGAVQSLAERWAPLTDESQEVLAEMILIGASGEDLVAMQDANSYQEVKRILLGRRNDGEDSVFGQFEDQSVQALALGALNEDLVFTPVLPCRVVDTRPFAGGTGAIAAGSSRSFDVHGDGTVIGGQGGNPAGCSAPQGEPRGVHINVTVVPLSGGGFLKVYPFNTPEPNASLVNFGQATNTANAASVKTCFGCGSDLTVKVSQTAHVVIDVLGYYYPAGLPIEQRSFLTTNLNSTDVTNVGSISIVAPGPGTIVVRAKGYIENLGENSLTRFGIGTCATTMVGGVWGGLNGTGIGTSGLFTPCHDEEHFPVAQAGTQTYYLNANLLQPGGGGAVIGFPRLVAQYIP